MKCYVSLVCFLSVFVFVSSAPFLIGNPSTQLQLGSGSSSNEGGSGGLTNILSQIDLPGLLQGLNSIVKLVGAICMPCGQVLDNVIQNVTSTAFRIFGRAILQGGGLGGGSGRGSGGGSSVNVVLPTFPPDEDDEDYEDETESSSGLPVEIVKTTTKSLSLQNEPSEDIPSSPNDESNVIARRHARITRAVADDQAVAESAPEPADLADIEDDQDRNKRFLPFGGGSGSGGSGNFLFDIVRNTADRAARMVGTVYRMVAGTQHFGWNPNSSTDKPQSSDYVAAQSSPAVQLVAGSGATEDSDEKANSPDGAEGEVHQKSVDAHYSEGIPGPVTRLLVIANRGIANLIQDLILRLAQTSEKLVNFKARLITSLI